VGLCRCYVGVHLKDKHLSVHSGFMYCLSVECTKSSFECIQRSLGCNMARLSVLYYVYIHVYIFLYVQYISIDTCIYIYIHIHICMHVYTECVFVFLTYSTAPTSSLDKAT